MSTHSQNSSSRSGPNQTETDYPRDSTVAALFVEQAAATPDAIAVRDEREAVNYRDLNQRANRFAQVLIEEGAGPETVVAIALERSVDLIVSMLAVLKTGASYLPLDRGYPAEMLRGMIDDSGATVLITGAGSHPGVRTGCAS